MEVGLVFDSFEIGDDMVRAFALNAGFKVCIRETNKKEGNIVRVRYSCSKRGSTATSGKHRNRKSEKCKCKVSIVLKRLNENVVVSYAMLCHNHELVSKLESKTRSVFVEKELKFLVANTNLSNLKMYEMIRAKFPNEKLETRDLYNDISKLKRNCGTKSFGALGFEKHCQQEREFKLMELVQRVCALGSENNKNFQKVVQLFTGAP